MRRFFSIAIVATAAAMMLWGCFKEVVGYTYYNIAVYEQTEQNGKTPRVEEVFSYAYYVDTTQWRIASWEDAEAGRITNKETGEVRDMPDEIGEFMPGEDFPVSIFINKEISMLVVVNPAQKMYAYRKYTLPINLSKVDTKLYFSVWKRSHMSSGWQIMNPFFGKTPPADDTTTPPADDNTTTTPGEGRTTTDDDATNN